MSEVKLHLSPIEQRQLEELRQRWRVQSPEEVIRDLISLGYLAMQKARRHRLAHEATGPNQEGGGRRDART
jgi:hypothetical protein